MIYSIASQTRIRPLDMPWQWLCHVHWTQKSQFQLFMVEKQSSCGQHPRRQTNTILFLWPWRGFQWWETQSKFYRTVSATVPIVIKLSLYNYTSLKLFYSTFCDVNVTIKSVVNMWWCAKFLVFIKVH